MNHMKIVRMIKKIVRVLIFSLGIADNA